MTSANSGVSRDALDALVSRAMDPSQAPVLRAAAAEALRDAPADVQAALGKIGAAAEGDLRGQAANDGWTDMVDGRLPASPDAVRQAVTERRSTARLIELQHLVDHLRRKEMQEKDAARREEWRVVRGAVHKALAARNRRLAPYISATAQPKQPAARCVSRGDRRDRRRVVSRCSQRPTTFRAAATRGGASILPRRPRDRPARRSHAALPAIKRARPAARGADDVMG
jgi:hypothetical protein